MVKRLSWPSRSTGFIAEMVKNNRRLAGLLISMEEAIEDGDRTLLKNLAGRATDAINIINQAASAIADTRLAEAKGRRPEWLKVAEETQLLAEGMALAIGVFKRALSRDEYGVMEEIRQALWKTNREIKTKRDSIPANDAFDDDDEGDTWAAVLNGLPQSCED